MTKIMPDKQYFPHYWICDECAKQRGGIWPKGHCATIAIKTCQYCEVKNHTESEGIAPWVDYDWPNIKTEHLRD